MQIKINQVGLLLNREYVFCGASPDGVSTEYCIEVKCPSSEKNITNYVDKGEIN